MSDLSLLRSFRPVAVGGDDESPDADDLARDLRDADGKKGGRAGNRQGSRRQARQARASARVDAEPRARARRRRPVVHRRAVAAADDCSVAPRRRALHLRLPRRLAGAAALRRRLRIQHVRDRQRRRGGHASRRRHDGSRLPHIVRPRTSSSMSTRARARRRWRRRCRTRRAAATSPPTTGRWWRAGEGARPLVYYADPASRLALCVSRCPSIDPLDIADGATLAERQCTYHADGDADRVCYDAYDSYAAAGYCVPTAAHTQAEYDAAGVSIDAAALAALRAELGSWDLSAASAGRFFDEAMGDVLIAWPVLVGTLAGAALVGAALLVVAGRAPTAIWVLCLLLSTAPLAALTYIFWTDGELRIAAVEARDAARSLSEEASRLRVGRCLTAARRRRAAAAAAAVAAARRARVGLGSGDGSCDRVHGYGLCGFTIAFVAAARACAVPRLPRAISGASRDLRGTRRDAAPLAGVALRVAWFAFWLSGVAFVVVRRRSSSPLAAARAVGSRPRSSASRCRTTRHQAVGRIPLHRCPKRRLLGHLAGDRRRRARPRVLGARRAQARPLPAARPPPLLLAAPPDRRRSAHWSARSSTRSHSSTARLPLPVFINDFFDRFAEVGYVGVALYGTSLSEGGRWAAAAVREHAPHVYDEHVCAFLLICKLTISFVAGAIGALVLAYWT